MSERNDGGPASPAGELDLSDRERPPAQAGMTLRDYFAAKAMTGYSPGSEVTDGAVQARADSAYRMADAMLKAREES